MKIGIDIRPFTTGSLYRGIGVYSKAFIKALIDFMPDAEFHYLNMYSGYKSALPENERCVLHNYYTGPQVTDVGIRQLFKNDALESILRAEAEHFIRHSSIDVMIFTSPNDFGNFLKPEWFEGVKTVCFLYDLIPLVFPEQYLFDDTFKNDYLESIELVKSMDMIFAISESGKTDAMKLLKIEEEKIEVIYPGADNDFCKLDSVDVKQIKDKYNIGFPFLLFAGGIDFKKNINLIVEAFGKLDPVFRNKYQLVIVGSTDDHFRSIMNQIALQFGVEDRLIFTGYVPKEDLIALYNVADMLVFPSVYEGFGLPVLEAMLCGTRVVTSNCSSLLEIAKGYATLVNPKSSKSIAKGITHVLENPVESFDLADKAMQYAMTFSWKSSALKAKNAIENLQQKQIVSKSVSASRFTVSDSLLESIASEYERFNEPLKYHTASIIAKQLVVLEDNVKSSCNWEPIRILFDMTVVREWVKGRYITGIGRVCTELLRHLGHLAEVVPVAAEGKKEMILRRVDAVTMDICEIIEPLANDVYFMPELQFKGIQVGSTHPSPRSLKEKGIKCYAVLYDILPIIMPQYFRKDTSNTTASYVNDMLRNYDGILGISRAVCDDLISYHKSIDLRINVKLGYFHLGSDSLENVSDDTAIPAEVQDFFDTNSEVFLMVGTVEPRKGHELVLDSFERIWQKGTSSAGLCIVGYMGWNMDKFMKKMKNHDEYGKKILYVEAASDACVRYAYKNADCLIQASAGEGFGLPLIEAANYGLPIICSDIPVFREVTSGHAMYFDRKDKDGLVNRIQDFYTTKDNNCLPDSGAMPTKTWDESAKDILDMITDVDAKWYATLGPPLVAG